RVREGSTPQYLTKFPMSYIWLPSVEQLMEMLDWPIAKCIYQMYDFVFALITSERVMPQTMKELWLMLLQYAHDGSRWDTERWVQG
ncbi:hypothetical protein LCGC14_3092150, partial [marine sediment metagenome]